VGLGRSQLTAEQPLRRRRRNARATRIGADCTTAFSH
jgi:hypothetical protein